MKLNNDPARQELSGEVEEVGVVEQDEELGQPPLLHHHGAPGDLTLHVTGTGGQPIEQYDFHQLTISSREPHLA